jgi:SagB-type dehydrogenase family enzyme
MTRASRYCRDALALNPDLLLCWAEGRLLVRDLQRRVTLRAAAPIVTLLDLFGEPRTPDSAVQALPHHDPDSVRRAVRELVDVGLLLPVAAARRRGSLIGAFRGTLASAHYHVAARDQCYLEDTDEEDALLRARLRDEAPPPSFKRYRTARRVRLPPRVRVHDAARTFDGVLRSRRTVRRFASAPVSRTDLAALVRGTWGRTGWLSDAVLGRLPAKTSPSAGGLHPIECYVFAWNVRGLARGLYHYDVRGDELRTLRDGDMSELAVEIASGQRWIARAAFLCVMTAVFGRTLWKYRLENWYRSVWLDAGHLAQTFCLLATSRGLGSFTTAAMQDSRIEALLGLDGRQEFPVYLCGAGVPAL